MSISLAVKAPCRVATSANITLSGLQTVDSVSLAANDRVLVRAQTDATENGIYVVASTAWTRAKDFNHPEDCVQGTMVYVHTGTYLGFHWVTTEDPEIGSTTIDWDWQTWTPTDEFRAVSSSGTSGAGAEGIAYVSFVGSSDGAATMTGVIQPAASFQSDGAAVATAVGASTVASPFSSAGSADGTASSLSGDYVYQFADYTSSAVYGDESYNLTTDVVQLVTAASVPSYINTAAATDTTAARIHGFTSSGTQAKKYTYVTQTTSNSTNSMRDVYNRAATQSETVGYFFGGFDGAAEQAYVDKITWATEAWAAGTALSAGRHSKPGATANASRAIVACGSDASNQVKTSEKYTFASDTVASGTSLGTERNFLAAAGNDTRGIFAGGYTFGTVAVAVTDKYTYSGDSVTSGTSLSAADGDISGAGNNTKGLFAGGSSTASDTDRYTYSSDVVSAGTNLAQPRLGASAACTNPGGF